MLVEQTMEKLVSMKLPGMAEALRRWLERPKEKDMSPLDLIGLLADAEWNDREQKRLTARLRNARFRRDATVEDIDYQHARGLAKSVMLDLAACRWVTAHQNVIFTGLTGVGKSYLACALGQKACRDGYTVVYRRASRLLDEVAQARADCTHFLLLRRLAKSDVLILDDFGLEVLNAAQRKDLLEVLEDRYGTSSTIVTSQLEPKEWLLRHRRRDDRRRRLRQARAQRPPREARRRVDQEGEGRLDEGAEDGEVDSPSGVTPRVIALAGTGDRHRPERAIGMAGTRTSPTSERNRAARRGCTGAPPIRPVLEVF